MELREFHSSKNKSSLTRLQKINASPLTILRLFQVPSRRGRCTNPASVAGKYIDMKPSR